MEDVYRQALAAGATSSQEPTDQPYGDRNAAVKDAFGNKWYIATHVKDVSWKRSGRKIGRAEWPSPNTALKVTV